MSPRASSTAAVSPCASPNTYCTCIAPQGVRTATPTFHLLKSEPHSCLPVKSNLADHLASPAPCLLFLYPATPNSKTSLLIWVLSASGLNIFLPARTCLLALPQHHSQNGHSRTICHPTLRWLSPLFRTHACVCVNANLPHPWYDNWTRHYVFLKCIMNM